ncbi:proteasome assembly chaperone family protein [Halorussus aquaticus]|uniref:Proteasome assembly chaperone family protein n=1 Tax=Halorussus aquaticus TaxID=2953748 RepID=A0ABD5Q2C4_9EURY|nr:PAC2 family protein [Halorussus aquaticus]
MPRTHANARFERRTEVTAESPTLIVGMPENGVVGSIAVEQITEQLELQHEGNIVSETFPPVATFGEGRVRDLVRVYAGTDPDVVVPHCDIALSPQANADLAACVVNDLAADYDRAIVLAAVPAQTEEQVGEVTGVVTSEAAENELRTAGVELDSSVGFIGGASGAVLNDCYHASVPTTALIVKAHPFLPDPQAAKAVIEKALEPLVDFDIDTKRLDEQADEIRRRMEQVAQHFESVQSGGEQYLGEDTSMYQ